MTELITTAEALQELIALARTERKKIAFVPTMGALHDGHLKLVEVAKNHAEFVVVSIFVNPTQFGKNEDFNKYPRNLDADLEKLEGLADLVFAPTVESVYPRGQNITHHAGPVGETFEGKARPGHFDGMLTVVARLFDLVTPDYAV
ncbi:MAG: pantoate--beta-alanine ligase, partial [Micrococcales bacterium]